MIRTFLNSHGRACIFQPVLKNCKLCPRKKPNVLARLVYFQHANGWKSGLALLPRDRAGGRKEAVFPGRRLISCRRLSPVPFLSSRPGAESLTSCFQT